MTQDFEQFAFLHNMPREGKGLVPKRCRLYLQDFDTGAVIEVKKGDLTKVELKVTPLGLVLIYLEGVLANWVSYEKYMEHMRAQNSWRCEYCARVNARWQPQGKNHEKLEVDRCIRCGAPRPIVYG